MELIAIISVICIIAAVLIYPDFKISSKVKKDFYSKGYKKFHSNNNVRVNPIEGFRVVDILYLKKGDEEYYVTIICKGWPIPKDIIVSTPKKINKVWR